MSKTLFITLKQLAYIPGFDKKSYGTRQRNYKTMREYYNKKGHQLLTITELAEYIGISEQKILEYLP